MIELRLYLNNKTISETCNFTNIFYSHLNSSILTFLLKIKNTFAVNFQLYLKLTEAPTNNFIGVETEKKIL